MDDLELMTTSSIAAQKDAPCYFRMSLNKIKDHQIESNIRWEFRKFDQCNCNLQYRIPVNEIS